MSTAPTAAMEVLLGLPPLQLQVAVEAKIENYRLCCNEQQKPKSEGFGHTYMTQDMEKEPILQLGSDKMIPRQVYDKPFMFRLPDRSEWKKGFQTDRKGGLIWYTDGSKTKKKAQELGYIAMEHGGNLVIAFGSTQQYPRQSRHVQSRI
jgi:hypothetical protein